MATPKGQSPEDGFIVLAQADPARARRVMRDSMDLAALCRSVKGRECLSRWIGLYERADSATAEAKHALLRMMDDSVHLVRKAVSTICRAMQDKGWTEGACHVATFQYGIDPQQHPQIAVRLLTAALLPGCPAPPVEGLRPSGKSGKANVVMFYDSQCRTCLAMLSELDANYPVLQQASVKVVTISTDSDRELFESVAVRFPWSDALCDTQGYESVNMVRWGVAATPTLFVVGPDGIVTGQYDSMNEIWELLVYHLKILQPDDIHAAVWKHMDEYTIE